MIPRGEQMETLAIETFPHPQWICNGFVVTTSNHPKENKRSWKGFTRFRDRWKIRNHSRFGSGNARNTDFSFSHERNHFDNMKLDKAWRVNLTDQLNQGLCGCLRVNEVAIDRTFPNVPIIQAKVIHRYEAISRSNMLQPLNSQFLTCLYIFYHRLHRSNGTTFATASNVFSN